MIVTTIKKPPDKPIDNPNITQYKCKKAILKNIIKDDNALQRIKEAVLKINKVVITTYQFIKAYYLFRLDKGKDIPTIDKEFIKRCMLVVCQKDGRGPPLKTETKVMVKKLTDYYDKYFSKVIKGKKIKISKLNQIIGYVQTSMETAFQNNISIHFIDRLNRYVNKSFITDDKIELRKVKNDLLNNTKISDKKYHSWIDKEKDKILPKTFTKTYNYDVKCNPMKYLSYSIYINKQLEKLECKQFHCFPLRTDIVPKYIEIDTSALLELLIDKGTSQYRNGKGQIEKSKTELWNKFFNMNNKAFKYNTKYNFDYSILTDGIGVSLRFIYKEKLKTIRKKKDDINILPYITDLDDTKLDEIKNNKCIYIDPNKGNILYCSDDDNNIFRYTRKQRLKETQRIKHQEIILKYKNKKGLIKLETEISNENGKTCDYKKFMKYLKIKNKVNSKLFIHYEEEFIRKIKLRTYINTQRSEGKLIRNIKNYYGDNNKKLIMIIGNGNVNPSMKHIISTPNIGIKKLLKKNFITYHIDEFRTSCLDHRTAKDNLIMNQPCKVVQKDGKNKRLHSVLVSKILNKNSGCYFSCYQQRDKNSVYNIRNLVQYYLKHKTRPYWFSRSIKLPDKKSYLEVGNDKLS